MVTHEATAEDRQYKRHLMGMGFDEEQAERIVEGRYADDVPTHKEWLEYMAEHGEPPEVDYPEINW